MTPSILKNMKLVLISFVAAFAAMFQFGYGTAVINPSQASLRAFINDSYKDHHYQYLDEDKFTVIFSLVVNVGSIGILIGTITTPFLVEKLGRKWLLIYSAGIDFIATTLQVIAFPLHEPALLTVGRLFGGIGSGVGAGAVALYIQEISPTNVRGLLSSFQAISNNLTTLLGMILGLPTVLGSVALLPYLMGIGILPGFLKLFLLPCPETPKYLLLKKDKVDDARSAIAFYHGPEANVEAVLAEIRKEGEFDNEKLEFDYDTDSKVEESWKLFQIMKTPHLRKGMLLGSVAFAGLASTGVIPLMEYSTFLLLSLDVQYNVALLVGILMGACFVLTSFVSLVLVEISGRKKLLMIGFVANILMLILLMVCFMVNTSSDWPGYLACVVIVSNVALFGIGPGTIPWYLTSELFPSSVRSTAQCFTMVVFVLVNFGLSFAFLPLFAVWGGYSFLALFIIPTIILAVYLYIELPETKNREISDIVSELKNKSKKVK